MNGKITYSKHKSSIDAKHRSTVVHVGNITMTKRAFTCLLKACRPDHVIDTVSAFYDMVRHISYTALIEIKGMPKNTAIEIYS